MAVGSDDEEDDKVASVCQFKHQLRNYLGIVILVRVVKTDGVNQRHGLALVLVEEDFAEDCFLGAGHCLRRHGEDLDVMIKSLDHITQRALSSSCLGLEIWQPSIQKGADPNPL